MTGRNIPFARLAAALALLGVVHAEAAITNPTPQRSYVSLAGSDANNCGPTAPCRTWQAALAQTQPGGEILTLNSGGFGLLTITQSVTLVVPPGVYGGMSPPAGQDGVVINAPGARVVLRGLTIEGQGGTNGINIQAAGTVLIEEATIEDMMIGVQAASAGALDISNSRLRANSGDGLALQPASGILQSRVTASDVSYNGTDGIAVGNNVQLVIRASSVSHNGISGTGWGIDAVGSAAPLSGASTTIGIDAQGNDLGFNATGAISLDDSASAPAAGQYVGAYLDHNDLAGGTSCLSVQGTAGSALSSNTFEACATGVLVGGSATAGSYQNNAIGLSTATNVGGTINQALPTKTFW